MSPRRSTCAVLASLTILAGCASVPAWERGNLAKPQMAFDQNPAESALRAHAYSSREAAAGGPVGAGGGCGCY
jgi:Domain of unknown function (DUF4266)